MRRRVSFRAAAIVGLVLFAGSPALAGRHRVVDNDDVVVLTGDVHPLARADNDAGAAPLSMPMERMILALRLAPEKQAALDRLLAEQQDPDSPNFHRWLTPEEFGARFGPSQEEIETVTDWLNSEGFVIDEVARGRTWINFTGVVADVERAFHTQIHEYDVDGALRHGNAWAPAIPRAMADLVAGVVSLHNFPRPALNTGVRPAYTGSTGTNAISPGDFAIIYDVNPVYSAGYNGTGRTIGIVARTHPSSSNWATFRSTMGLSATTATVIVNGTDPGDLGASEDNEADLDEEWSGGVARGATVDFVVSKSTSSTDGVDLSAQYIVNNNLTDVMSTSFGQCESSMGSSENTFYNNLWSQAASEGITSFVSTGDSGASGCDSGSSRRGTRSGGLGPRLHAVQRRGGRHRVQRPDRLDVLERLQLPRRRVREELHPRGRLERERQRDRMPVGRHVLRPVVLRRRRVLDLHASPRGRCAPGVPSANTRYVPDWSFTAASHDGYLVETQGALDKIGGTSASSPSSAGVMAIICQKTGSRQGLANTRIYQLANAQYASGGPVVFHDITSGNNSVPRVTGYSCTTGYDEVTGVGSVDVNALANNWVAATYGISGTVSGAVASGVTVNLAGASTASTTTGTGGTYTFGGLANGSYTVTPSLSGYTFSPTSTAVTISGANQTGIDFSSTAVSGPTTLFSDGFEGTGWSTAQVSRTTGAWTLVSSSLHPSISAHGGSRWADFNSYTSANGSQTRLYQSSGFAVGNYGTVTLTFWMYHDTKYPGYADRVQAQVSTNGTRWANVGPAVNRSTGSAGWAQVTVDISSYRGSASLQVGFLGISAYGDDEYLDDVAVTASGTGPTTHTVSGTITYNTSGLAGVTVSTTGASATTGAGGASRALRPGRRHLYGDAGPRRLHVLARQPVGHRQRRRHAGDQLHRRGERRPDDTLQQRVREPLGLGVGAGGGHGRGVGDQDLRVDSDRLAARGVIPRGLQLVHRGERKPGPPLSVLRLRGRELRHRHVDVLDVPRHGVPVEQRPGAGAGLDGRGHLDECGLAGGALRQHGGVGAGDGRPVRVQRADGLPGLPRHLDVRQRLLPRRRRRHRAVAAPASRAPMSPGAPRTPARERTFRCRSSSFLDC